MLLFQRAIVSLAFKFHCNASSFPFLFTLGNSCFAISVLPFMRVNVRGMHSWLPSSQSSAE